MTSSDVRSAAQSSVRSVDHVAIAVEHLHGAVELYADHLGGRFVNGGDSVDKGLRTIQFSYPSGSKIELIAPLGKSSHLWRFLEARGPGLHHVTLLVPDIQSTMTSLSGTAVELTEADLSGERWKEIYTRPKSTDGVLIQFAETDIDWAVARNVRVTLDDVLNGRARWEGQECRLV